MENQDGAHIMMRIIDNDDFLINLINVVKKKHSKQKIANTGREKIVKHQPSATKSYIQCQKQIKQG